MCVSLLVSGTPRALVVTLSAMILRQGLYLVIALVATALSPRHAATFESDEQAVSSVRDPGASISTAAFFSNPTISLPRISPDGKHIVFLFSKDDDQRVFARSVGGKEAIGLAGFSIAEARVREIAWANSNRLLLTTVAPQPDATGNQRWVARLAAVDIKRPRLKWLTEKWGPRGPNWPLTQERFPDRVISLIPGDRDNVLVSHLDFGERTPSVSRLNLYSGRLRPVERAQHGIGAWHAAERGSVLAAEALYDPPEGKQYILFARSDREAKFEAVFRQSKSTESDFAFAGYHENPGHFYVFANHEGRRALFEFDAKSKALGLLVYANAEFDVSGLHRNATGDKLVGVEFVADEPEIAFIDEAARKEQASIDYSLKSSQPGATTNRVISSTRDGNMSIVEVSGATQPPVYYAYNREKKEMNFVFEQRPDLAADRLAAVSRVDIQNRTGEILPAYLTRPRDAGEGNLPMIVLTHAGFGSRASMAFNPVVQFFAARGFAVLQVNHRGSGGYGRAFELAGAAHPMATAQEDIADAVTWATQQGIADTNRVGIFGEGSGGTIAMLALASSPELFRAGVSYGASMHEEQAKQDEEASAHSENESKGSMQPESATPLERASAIKAPVLVAHGARDARVPVQQARDFVSALKDAETPVESIEFDDEFDGIALGNNRVDFYDRVAKFFLQHLAGSQALDPDVASANSSSSSLSSMSSMSSTTSDQPAESSPMDPQ